MIDDNTDEEWARYNYTPPAPPTPGATYPWWSDPDSPPPEWMLNQSQYPSDQQLAPGQYWDWLGDHWGMRQMPTATSTTPQTTPTGGGDTPTTYGGGGGYVGGRGAYPGGAFPGYNAPDYLDPGAFDPGPAFTFKEFMAPTGDTMLQEPGFQFRLDQGRKALEASAAGKGILRSGGTLKDILGYGQNFASQEYGNVFNRALQEYDTNRGNAADIWQKQYGQRGDVFQARANNYGQKNTFNLGNAQNDYQARRDAAMDEFNRWKAEGDWLTSPSWSD